MNRSEVQSGFKVFVSYARRDASQFTGELFSGLEAAGFDPFLDKEDIAPGEDWEHRLESLLRSADAVIFVISAASVESDRCRWEIQKAFALSKKIIPVVAMEVPETTIEENLRRLNFIYFSQPNSFGPGLKKLSESLRTDLVWVREHTRLAELAQRWQGKDRDHSLKLRGAELVEAIKWQNRWQSGLPELTAAHRDFISESENAERLANSKEEQRFRREKRLSRLVMLFGLLLFAGVVVAAVFVDRSRRHVATQRQEIDQQEEQIRQQSEEIVLLSKQLEIRSSERQTLPIEAAGAGEAPAELSRSDDQALEVKQVDADTEVERSLNQARINLGWDIDIFWCAGPASTESQALADRLAKELSAERDRQLAAPPGTVSDVGFSLGRLRVRELREEVNARPSYGVKDNQLRAEAQEQEEGIQLRDFLNARADFLPVMKQSTQSTPFYLSVFACDVGSG